MATEIVSQTVKRIGDGLYQVASETVEGRSYTVDLKAGTCQCCHYHYRLRGKVAGDCKHVAAARARAAEVAAKKARTIPDVTIDELAARYQDSRPEISAVLYAEIIRRTTAMAETAETTEDRLKAVFA